MLLRQRGKWPGYGDGFGGGVFASYLLLAILLAGCTSTQLEDATIGPAYQPANVFCLTNRFPKELRRVAVLPLTASSGDSSAQFGRDSLEPVLRMELGKSGACEWVFVSAADLKRRTGRSDWTSEEQLPADFLVRLKESLDCDAVLFSRLTQYRAYPPVALGWNLKMVDTRTERVWWAVDEVFDGSKPGVSNGARKYYLEHLPNSGPLADSHSILGSPAQFAHYSVNTLLATLPRR